MSEPEPKTKPRVGRGVLASLCALSLALIVLSGCRVYVSSSGALNPFLGEWHTDDTREGVRFSAEYEFHSNGRYHYRWQDFSGGRRDEDMDQGTYDYDGDTLFLTPDPGDGAPSQFEYEFPNDNVMELRERTGTGGTRTRIYHRHE